MKNIFTLAALFISIGSFAAERPKPAKLAITSSDKGIIQVKIDGVTHKLDKNTFVMNNLSAGNHNITITKLEVAGFRTRSTVLYNSNLYISPAQFVDIDINRNGKVKLSKSNMGQYDRNDQWRNNDDRNGRDNDRYNDRDYNDRNNSKDRNRY